MTVPDFLRSGIYFSCQGCGSCCTGESGTIYVAQAEVPAIAAFLGLDSQELIARHLYPFQDSYSIREDDQGACHFYQQGCLIYAVRPWQCKSFPFWFKNLRSARNWHLTRKECPGIGQGRWYSPEEILHMAQQTMHI
jgi:hypothetical protein